MDNVRDYLLSLETDRTAGETSFMNPAYEDNTVYNTGDNLSSDSKFLTQLRPHVEMPLISQQLNFTIIADQLKDALKGTDWKYTNTGIDKLAPRIYTEGAKLNYVPKAWEINEMSDIQKLKLGRVENMFCTLSLTKPDGTFYSEKTLKGKYGGNIIERIEKINVPRRSIKGILLLFISDYADGKRDSEKFENPKLTKVKVTIEGISNKIFPEGMRMLDHWPEIKKHFCQKI